jgi:hypothetical protein
MINWMPYFFKEIEKQANVMNLGLAAFAGFDLKSRVKEGKELNATALEPLKQKEEQLQLPGSNTYDFAGGKRIN